MKVTDHGVGAGQLDGETPAKKAAIRNYLGAVSQDEAGIKGSIDVSTNTTLSASAEDYLIRVTTGSNDITITLPASSSIDDGFDLWIRKADAGTGNVIVARSGSDTIDGSGSTYTAITRAV